MKICDTDAVVALFGLDQRGVSVLGPVLSGLPSLTGRCQPRRDRFADQLLRISHLLSMPANHDLCHHHRLLILTSSSSVYLCTQSVSHYVDTEGTLVTKDRVRDIIGRL
jgi:hypothetical protein